MLTLSVLACNGPPIDPPPADADEVVAEDIGTSVSVVLGPAGGILETTQDGVTYQLTVPQGALVDDKEIILTPARLVGVVGSSGARFEPDGLALAVPATLTILPGPAGDVLVAVQDGPFPVEAELAIGLADRVVFAVPHFSTHAAASSSGLGSALPADVRQAIAGLTGLSREEVAAIALGIFFRTHVEPLLPLSARDVHGFGLAAGAAAPWFKVVNDAGDLIRSLPHTQGGTETVAELAATIRTDLVAAGLELYGRVTPPLCSGTPDILGVLDWGRMSHVLQGHLVSLGEPVQPGTCLSSRLTVEGPTSMTATSRELHFSLLHEVQGPPSDPRVVPDEAAFSLGALGATGPSTVTEGNGGDVRDVVFIREPGAERARVVTLTVNATSLRAQIATILPPDPVIYTLVEEGTALSLSATPSSLSSSGETAQVCATVTFDDEPLASFLARFSVTGPGALEPSVFETSEGEACATYLPPAPLPQTGAQVGVHALVAVGGGELRQSASIELAPGGLQVALTAAPDTVDTAEEPVEVCATVSSGGAPVASFDVQFTLAGPGALDETDVISVSNPEGRVCIGWTAPASIVAGQTATVSAHATAEGLSADGSVEISLEEAPPPPPSIYEGSWVGVAEYSWTKSVDNSSPGDSVVTEQQGAGTFEVSCTLAPPSDEFLNRISDCAITNHVGSASYTTTRHQGPLMCDLVTEQGITCTSSMDCAAPHQCLSPPEMQDRCALCLGVGAIDTLTLFETDFEISSVGSPNSFFQVLAEGGQTRLFVQQVRAPAPGHFSQLSTCSVSGPDCSESTAEPMVTQEADLNALELPSVVFTEAMGELPTTLVPGGTVAGSVELGIGSVVIHLEHVP